MGTKKSGRKLVGAALAAYIRNHYGKKAYALDQQSRLKPIHFHPNSLNDLLLVSGSNKIGKWMKPWFDRFGDPLFTITIRRHDRW
jgi:hypothetical protein